MGVVNVTPDSFSDGGLWLDPARAAEHGARASRRGRGDPRHRRRVDASRCRARLGRRGAAARPARHRAPHRGGPAGADQHRHVEGRGRQCGAAGGRRLRQRRHRLPRRAAARRARRAGGLRLLPDAHAGRAAHDAGRPALRGGRVRRRGASSRSVRRSPSSRGSRPSGSPSIRASASGRRSPTTSSCCARLDEIAALGFPVVVGISRKRFLGTLTGREEPSERVAAGVAANVLAYERGASVFRVHDVAPTVDALKVAAGTLRAMEGDSDGG